MEAAAKVSERENDIEARFVLMNYESAAAREPIEERRKMLAHAAAAIVDVRMTVAEHARVQRRLDEIEPADVLALYGLSRTYGYVYKQKRYGSEDVMRGVLLDDVGCGEALESAGCVQRRAPKGTYGGRLERVIVTSFGHLVLKVLRTYCRTRAIPFEVPGREVIAGERGREFAHATLDALSTDGRSFAGAVAAVALSEGHECRYSAPTCSLTTAHDGDNEQPNVKPPLPDGAAWIAIDNVEQGEAEQLQAFAPPASGTAPPMHGTPTKEVRVHVQKQHHGNFAVQIHGPHDVLRHLADDLDIRWF
ncbi:MAG: hypothetical protein U0270_11150 [Labilithrix sp.]